MTKISLSISSGVTSKLIRWYVISNVCMKQNAQVKQHCIKGQALTWESKNLVLDSILPSLSIIYLCSIISNFVKSKSKQ